MLEFKKGVLSLQDLSVLRTELLSELEGLELYLKQIFDDVQLLDDAEYEIAYRCYDTYTLGEDGLSEAYEKLGRAIYRCLKEAEVYESNLLQFSFHRLLGNDIVLIRTDL